MLLSLVTSMYHTSRLHNLVSGRSLLELLDAAGKTPYDLASDEMKVALSEVVNANELQSPSRVSCKFEPEEEG
jgi:hypothetical protein